MMKKFIFSILGLLVLSQSINTTAGTFHYQIDVMSHLLSNQNNQFNILQMSWLYDEKMTQMLLQDEDLSPKKKQQSLDEVGDLIMADLKGLNYFIKLQLNSKPLKFSHSDAYSVELLEGKFLRLLFDIPLVQAINPNEMKLSISLVDPNGAALLFYDTDERVTIEPPNSDRCMVKLDSLEEFEHGKAAQHVNIYCK